MLVDLKMYVILNNYTVGVWLTNAHKPPFQTQKKTRGYNAHMTHKCPRLVMATWPPGHQPASERVVWTLPT
jgi:hypothetical protein